MALPPFTKDNLSPREDKGTSPVSKSTWGRIQASWLPAQAPCLTSSISQIVEANGKVALGSRCQGRASTPRRGYSRTLRASAHRTTHLGHGQPVPHPRRPDVTGTLKSPSHIRGERKPQRDAHTPCLLPACHLWRKGVYLLGVRMGEPPWPAVGSLMDKLGGATAIITDLEGLVSSPSPARPSSWAISHRQGASSPATTQATTSNGSPASKVAPTPAPLLMYSWKSCVFTTTTTQSSRHILYPCGPHLWTAHMACVYHRPGACTSDSSMEHRVPPHVDKYTVPFYIPPHLYQGHGKVRVSHLSLCGTC